MEGITKVFPGVVANERISFEVLRGEIHALLGENGAGKSTLMNILCGLTRPDDGRILLDGRPVEIHSPRLAIEHGIGFVHQHFMLVPTFSVVQNLVMGLREGWDPRLRLEDHAEKFRSLAEGLGVRIDPWAETESLPLGTRQKVEILKTLYRGARLLVMDEPTAVLVPQEVEDLFATLRSLVRSGVSVVFITHKLDEVKEISDRVTVLRGGRKVETLPTAEVSAYGLAERMVGRKVSLAVDKPEVRPGEPVLEVRRLTVEDGRGRRALENVSLTVREGEILGIAGVDGNGQRELMEVLFGLRRPSSGEVRVGGEPATDWRPRDLLARNVGRIPEDRHDMGLVLDMTVGENLFLERFHVPPANRMGFLRRRAIRRRTQGLIESHAIRPPLPDIPVRNLSGGNQQKVILARVLSEEPKLLIAVNPTRGLDVGATEFVYESLLRARENRSAVLFISSELSEILSLSDRIAVLFEGRIQGLVDAAGADLAQLGLWMTGRRREPAGEAGEEPA